MRALAAARCSRRGLDSLAAGSTAQPPPRGPHRDTKARHARTRAV